MRHFSSDTVSLPARRPRREVVWDNSMSGVTMIYSGLLEHNLICSSRVDEIRVLLPTASEKLSKHLNPDMVA